MKVSSALPKKPSDPLSHLRTRIAEAEFSNLVDQTSLSKSDDTERALQSELSRLRLSQARNRSLHKVTGNCAKALGLAALGGLGWAVFGGGTPAQITLWASAAGAGLCVVGLMQLEDRNSQMRSDLIQLNKLQAQAGTLMSGGRDTFWQSLRVNGLNQSSRQQLSEAFGQWMTDGETFKIAGEIQTEPARLVEALEKCDRVTLFDHTYYDNCPLESVEDLEFVDLLFGGGSGKGLAEPGLAEAIKRISQKDNYAFRDNGHGIVHPLMVYRNLTGKRDGSLKLTSRDLVLTREGLLYHIYQKQGEDLGLADPSLASRLAQMAEADYNIGDPSWCYDHLVNNKEGAIRVTLPDSELQLPVTADDLRHDRLADKALEVERLKDTYLWQGVKKWGDKFDTTAILSGAYALAEEGLDLKLATRTLGVLTQAELDARLCPNSESSSASDRAEEGLRLLKPWSKPAEQVLEECRLLGSLLTQLPRHHALTGMKAALEPVGSSTTEQRVELFQQHMIDETYTLQRKQFNEDPTAMERLYLEGYITKAQSQFAPDKPQVADRLRAVLLNDGREDEFGFEEGQVTVGDISVEVFNNV